MKKLILFGLKFGPQNALLKFRQRKFFQISPPINVSSKETSTAFSTLLVPSYLTTCDLATKNKTIFDNFRRYEAIYEVYDHVSMSQGYKYLDVVRERDFWTDERQDFLRLLDGPGNPKKFKFGSIGLYSPLMMRYLKVASDIQFLFGNLKELVIGEIGVGFGAQAALIDFIFKPKQVLLYDLPAVLKLVKFYYSYLDICKNVSYFDGREPISNSLDLVVSNYAFSELERSLQDMYLEHVVLKSSRGYITWNWLSEEMLGGYSVGELCRMIPGSQITAEFPLTSVGNCVIYWGSPRKMRGLGEVRQLG